MSQLYCSFHIVCRVNAGYSLQLRSATRVSEGWHNRLHAALEDLQTTTLELRANYILDPHPHLAKSPM